MISVRVTDDLPLYDEIHAIHIVTARIKERVLKRLEDGSVEESYEIYDKFFSGRVGQHFKTSEMTITRIVWNKNYLLEKGINRYEIWAKNKSGAEQLWQWFDNPISVNPTCDKN